MAVSISLRATHSQSFAAQQNNYYSNSFTALTGCKQHLNAQRGAGCSNRFLVLASVVGHIAGLEVANQEAAVVSCILELPVSSGLLEVQRSSSFVRIPENTWPREPRFDAAANKCVSVRFKSLLGWRYCRAGRDENGEVGTHARAAISVRVDQRGAAIASGVRPRSRIDFQRVDLKCSPAI